jgi:alcohol dehydrogenase (cytochrome c)
MKKWAVLSALLVLSVLSLSTKTARADGSASDDWVTINKDYSSQRYVDLDQITPQNVGQLKEICELQLNQPTFYATGLLKVGRTLYVGTNGFTAAFDAATCRLRWQSPVVLESKVGTANHRGEAYMDGKIFRSNPDGRLIALDAKTGELLWGAQAAISNPPVTTPPTPAETLVAAPIAWRGKVFIGIAVGDFGTAGRLMAFDAKDGTKLWSFNTTLGFPSGGAFWTTYSLDPKTSEVFGPVANPYPDLSRLITPGDKTITKYTDSVISVDAKSGKLNWSYQFVPGDEHDWDLSPAPTLYRTSQDKNGKDMLAIAGKSGRVYAIDRETKFLAFDTPATTLKNDQVPLKNTYRHVCPGQNGGAMFNGAAYHPGTGALYVGMVDFCAWYLSNPKILPGGGVPVKDWASAAKLQAPRGWITAIDGKSGAVRWQYQTQAQVLAGLVPTKSGLLFAGDQHGNLLIFKAADGTLLKSIDTGGALNNGLISYSVAGQQYVAATVGGSNENPSTVAGPLRVVVYGLSGRGKPNVVTLPRLEPSPGGGIESAGQAVLVQACAQCHSADGSGASAPPLFRQSQLAEPALLKQFLATVPPPMPRLYPGVLTDDEVTLLADYLKTAIFKCGPNEPQSCAPPTRPMTGGTPSWRAVYSVLTSPRCINCHPVASPKLPPYAFNPATNAQYPQDYPRQGDDRHPHYFTVLRGDTFPLPTAEHTGIVYPGKGTPFERCISCHGTKNDPVTGIPGTTNPEGTDPAAPFWALAPASMAWESAPGAPLNGATLCVNLLNKQLNGNREPKDLLRHITKEALVNWGFSPGIRPNGERRTTPPLTHAAFIDAFKRWIAEGTPCPAQ